MIEGKSEAIERLRSRENPEAISRDLNINIHIVKEWLDKIIDDDDFLPETEIAIKKAQDNLMAINTEIAENGDVDDALQKKIRAVSDSVLTVAPSCLKDKNSADAFVKVCNGISAIQTSLYGKGDVTNVALLPGMPAGFKKFLGD